MRAAARNRTTLARVAVIAGVVLAAGAGRRMGGPKAELVVDGVRLVDRAVGVLTAAGCAPVLAVVRAGTAVPGARAVVNPDPDRGMRSSLEIAVDAVAGEADALLVLLVDTPRVGADAVAAVRAAWRPGRIAVARYGDRRGHPIAMAVDQWRESVAYSAPDEGARAYLAAHEREIDEVAAPGDPRDLDTPPDVSDGRD